MDRGRVDEENGSGDAAPGASTSGELFRRRPVDDRLHQVGRKFLVEGRG